MKKITKTTTTKTATTTPAAKRGRPAKVAPVAAPAAKRGRPAKAAPVAAPAAKRGRPAKVAPVAAPAAKRGRPAKAAPVAVVAKAAPVAKRGRPVVIPNTVIPSDVMPPCVADAINSAINNQHTPEAHKPILTEALAITPYRFTAMHDVVRQAVRNAALKALKQNGYLLNHTARLFGIASANLKKWRDEEMQGIHNIRARGRPEGKKNEYRTIIHNGKEVKVRIEDTTAKTRIVNGTLHTVYRLKSGVELA